MFSRNIHNILLESIKVVLSESYEKYADLVEKVIGEANEYLSDYGLSVFYQKNYDFSFGMAKNFLAVYKKGSVRRNNGRMSVSINFENLLDGMDRNNVKDVERQIRVSIFHEVGHGIVEWIKSLRRKDTQGGFRLFRGDIVNDFRAILRDEENVVEEFGAFNAYWTSYSVLNYFLNDYRDILLEIAGK